MGLDPEGAGALPQAQAGARQEDRPALGRLPGRIRRRRQGGHRADARTPGGQAPRPELPAGPFAVPAAGRRSSPESGDIRVGDGDLRRAPTSTHSCCEAPVCKEHLLIAGRSGSGKTNLTFVLMQGIMARGIKVLALDWKRGYRDLLQLRPDLRVYTHRPGRLARSASTR